MTPDDVDTILKKLGTTCKGDIKRWQGKGYGVYIPQGAYKAETISITTKNDRDADADVKLQIGKIKPGFTLSDNNSTTVTVSGKNFYYKIVPAAQ
ncbi:hypothetical protein DXT98_01375 [Agrobacterium sp. ICMP 7243]|nr:hypothetical protein DXT98_01375 [Agrobacterium sp. ICMP 7243]